MVGKKGDFTREGTTLCSDGDNHNSKWFSCVRHSHKIREGGKSDLLTHRYQLIVYQSIIAMVQHSGSKVFHDGRILNVEITKHFDESDNFGVYSGIQECIGASSS